MLTHRDFLERNADWRADSPALRVPTTDSMLTWSEVDERVNRVGNGLTARGIRPGDRVGVILHNILEFPL
ncbi:MAG: AMP-binding protein, partial [Salinirussus sp.]